jgi:hypothetical protein
VLVAALAACSFRDNRATGDGSGNGSADAITIDAPVDARLDGAPGSAKMKVITVHANKIGGALTAFPMWFVIDDSDLHAHATATGTDIYFTKTDGAPLPFERQRWTSASGHLEAWILVDLDPAMTNAIQLRYGDPGPATNPNPRAVFANGFLSVWHFEDAQGSLGVVDTVGNQPGLASAFTSMIQTTAQLGGGFSFDGSSTLVTFTNQLLGPGAHTISAWVKLPNTGFSGFASIVTLGDMFMDRARFLHARYNSGLGYGWFMDDTTNGPDASDNQFHLVHWVFNPGAPTNKQSLFRDAAAALVGSPFGVPSTQGTTGIIGNSPAAFTPGGNTSNAIKGVLDEVRIATVPRSAQWITTEFNNQGAPAMFYSVGAEMPAAP